MSKKDFAFGKDNIIWIVLSVVVIIIGFVLMSGGGLSEDVSFNPAIFNTRRIAIAPVVCMVGFGLMIFAILKSSREGKEAE